MHRLTVLSLGLIVAAAMIAQPQRTRPAATGASDEEQQQSRSEGSKTMKPLVSGTHYAAASMKVQATMAAEHVLAAGGNAFDAIVAGQAVLGVVHPDANGIGSDAVL